MKVNRKELIRVLSLIKPGLARQELLEQTTHFIFDRNKIRTYNDRIMVEYPFEIDGIGAVKAKEFFELLQKLSDEELDINFSDREILIEGKEVKAGIKIEKEIKIPEIGDKPERGEWKELPNNFVEAISSCIFSASKDMTTPVLCCLYINDNLVISCDNFRATKVEMSSNVNHFFLLSGESAFCLKNYDIKYYIIGSNWLFFKTLDDLIFSCRIVSGKYPDIFPFFKVRGQEICLPEGFCEVLGRARTMIAEDFYQDEFVSLSIVNGELTCSGEGNFGWIKEKSLIDYNGEQINIKVNPIFLGDILNHLKKIIVGKNSLLFKGDDFEHVVCLS